MRVDIEVLVGLLALIAGGVIVAVILLLGNGGGSSVCDRPLAPLSDSKISQLAFEAEDVGLARVIEAASAGNAAAAEQAFSYANGGEIRNFTHNVDAPLREVDEELAKELCEAVIEIEEAFLSDRRPDRVAMEATRLRETMRDAAEAMGYARPGE